MGDLSNFATWKIRLDIIANNNYVLEFIQGQVHNPPENASTTTKENHKKGELKVKKITVDCLQDNLISYVRNFRKSKDMHDKLACMYEVKNLNEIIFCKYQLKYMKVNK